MITLQPVDTMRIFPEIIEESRSLRWIAAAAEYLVRGRAADARSRDIEALDESQPASAQSLSHARSPRPRPRRGLPSDAPSLAIFPRKAAFWGSSAEPAMK